MTTTTRQALTKPGRGLLRQRGAKLRGDRVRLKTRGGGRAARVEELDGGSQLAPVRLPSACAAAFEFVQALDERAEVGASDARAHYRHGPGVVRVVNAVAPTFFERRRDEEDAPARVVRDGREGRGVARRVETRRAVDVARERDERQPRLRVFEDARATRFEALKC